MLVDAGDKSLSISPYTYYVMSQKDVEKMVSSASTNPWAHTVGEFNTSKCFPERYTSCVKLLKHLVIKLVLNPFHSSLPCPPLHTHSTVLIIWIADAKARLQTGPRSWCPWEPQVHYVSTVISVHVLRHLYVLNKLDRNHKTCHQTASEAKAVYNCYKCPQSKVGWKADPHSPPASLCLLSLSPVTLSFASLCALKCNESY